MTLQFFLELDSAGHVSRISLEEFGGEPTAIRVKVQLALPLSEDWQGKLSVAAFGGEGQLQGVWLDVIRQVCPSCGSSHASTKPR